MPSEPGTASAELSLFSNHDGDATVSETNCSASLAKPIVSPQSITVTSLLVAEDRGTDKPNKSKNNHPNFKDGRKVTVEDFYWPTHLS